MISKKNSLAKVHPDIEKGAKIKVFVLVDKKYEVEHVSIGFIDKEDRDSFLEVFQSLLGETKEPEADKQPETTKETEVSKETKEDQKNEASEEKDETDPEKKPETKEKDQNDEKL